MRYTPPGLRMRPMMVAGMAFALAVATAVRTAAADVAEFIPSDALVVFKINNLQKVNQEASALLREFGIAEQNPDMADPLASFQRETGIRNGLNLGGNVAVYLANGNLDEESPPMVVLMPVNDYQAFVNNFKVRQDMGGGITRVQMHSAREGAEGEGDDAEDEDEGDGDEDDFGYVMQMGDYAAISPKRELLKKPAQAIQFGGVTGDRLDQRDIIMYANFRQLGPMITQKLNEENAREQAKEEALRDLQEDEATARFAPVASAMIDTAFKAMETFLRDAEAATVTVDFSDQGIGFGTVAQFKPNSYMASMFAKLKATEEPLVSGLPEATYIAFGGSTNSQEFNTQLYEDLIGPVIQELRKVGDGDKMGEYLEAIRTQMTAAGETRFGWLAPSGALGAGSVIQTFTVQGGDVEKLLAAQRKAAQLQPEIMASLMGEQMQDMNMNVEMEYTQNARTVSGVSFDKLGMKQDPNQQQGGMDPMKMAFGPEGPVTYLGQVDGKLLSIMGLSEQQMTSVIEAVKGNRAPLANARPLQVVNENLPRNRSAVFYFAPDELARSGLGLARQMGMNVPVQLPEDLPPVGVAVGPTENAVQVESFISKDLISAMIVAALQAQQQLGGGDDF